MRRLVVRVILSMLAVAGLVFLGACAGGGSPSTTAGASTSTTLASATTLQPSTTDTTQPTSSTTSSEATATSESPTSTGSGAAASSNTWTNLNPSGTLPTVRTGQSLAYAAITDQVIMFGGADLSNGVSQAAVTNDTWAYDPSANTWTNLTPSGTPPSVRTGCSLVYGQLTHLVYMFGGYGNGTSFNDIWAYDPAANTWTNLNPTGDVPSPRSDSKMVYDAIGDELIMFGGMGVNGLLNDTWAYDPAANTWTNLNPAGAVPSARHSCSMAYAMSTAKVIMFGGAAGNSALADGWAYDPAANTWTNLNPTGAPSPRYDSAMAYDDNTAQVILFGGGTGQYVSLNDTWAYDSKANTWTNLNPAVAPSVRTAPSLADDESTHQLIMFGGWQEQGANVGTGFNDTWSYTP
jgi:N-acetylneuraminic acid mutarotase